jgi:hypothetical protein
MKITRDKRILYHFPHEAKLRYSCGDLIKIGDLVRLTRNSNLNNWPGKLPDNMYLLVDIFLIDNTSFDDIHAYCAYIYYNGNTVLANLDELYKIN